MSKREFMSAAALGISPEVHEALVKTLGLFESGKMRHVSRETLIRKATRPADRVFTGEFNMSDWAMPHTCGTVCCIGGTAELIGGLGLGGLDDDETDMLNELFYPREAGIPYSKITPEHATRALASYLTTGNPNWRSAIAELENAA
jgi:hypothetical protein